MNVARDEGGVHFGTYRGPIDREELRTLLFRYAEAGRDRKDPEGYSRTVVRIRCHGDVPFREVQRIFVACMDPEVRIYRIHLSVRVPWDRP